jgi:hypothetical protein
MHSRRGGLFAGIYTASFKFSYFDQVPPFPRETQTESCGILNCVTGHGCHQGDHLRWQLHACNLAAEPKRAAIGGW